MVITKSNAIVAGLISIANSVFPFLILVGALHWSSDTVAAAMLVVTNTVTFGGLLFSGTPTSSIPPGN